MFHWVHKKGVRYPAAPFSPDRIYPELEGFVSDTDAQNEVYGLCRELFRRAGMDAPRFGRADWDPLAELVRGRRLIVIKPNLVLHLAGELQCSIAGLVVHASVIRSLVDYLLLAISRAGSPAEIVIADTPLQGADFARLCKQNGLAALHDFYARHGLPVRLTDMRQEQAVINENFLILKRVPLPGDPRGTRVVDLGTESTHYSPEAPERTLAVQDYESSTTNLNHSGKVHRYRFGKTILDADLVINLCKLKTHMKAGVTLALKNVVGANISKDYLPHFRPGGPRQGGDEFGKDSRYQAVVRRVRDYFNRRAGGRAVSGLHYVMKRAAYAMERRRRRNGKLSAYGGAWYGNDTLWRTIVDINRILFFADAEGRLHSSPQRAVLCMADGIVGMEGEGPMKGRDLPVGLLAWGDDPVEFDANLAWMMGFDPQRIPHIRCWAAEERMAVGRYPAALRAELEGAPRFRFTEPSGWVGRLVAEETLSRKPAAVTR